MPPQIRHTAWVALRPKLRASAGSINENPKHTSEYIPKQTPAHSTPAVYRGEFVSAALKTLRATATGKYSHMQNNPSQVQIWTQASWRMTVGMARMDARISRAPRSEEHTSELQSLRH